jgi:hypothetical protein
MPCRRQSGRNWLPTRRPRSNGSLAAKGPAIDDRKGCPIPLTDLYPVVGRLPSLTGDLLYAGAAFIIELNQLDDEEQADFRACIDVGRLDRALAGVESATSRERF